MGKKKTQNIYDICPEGHSSKVCMYVSTFNYFFSKIWKDTL